MTEEEALRLRCQRQAREITELTKVLHRKNVELDALHMVWCDGGCPGGVHRWTSEVITPEIVEAAERNTKRLRAWFDHACFRLKTYPQYDEWYQEYAAKIARKVDPGEPLP